MTAQKTKPMTAKALKAARTLLIECAATVVYDAYTYEYNNTQLTGLVEPMIAADAVAKYLSDNNQDAMQQNACYEYWLQLVAVYNAKSIKHRATMNLLYAEIEMAAAEKIDAYLNV